MCAAWRRIPRSSAPPAHCSPRCTRRRWPPAAPRARRSRRRAGGASASGRWRRSVDDALAAGTLAGLGAALARSDPGTAAAGLVHTDFCGDNFVVDAHGALHVIDNERVSVGAFGYDLARTWVRWNLGDADWARFATAYAAHGGPAAAFAAPAFWRLVASLGTAALRLEFGLGTPVSSARLDRVVAELA
ncbi:MAG: phosphotransferase [Candidatus Binatia bacterium]